MHLARVLHKRLIREERKPSLRMSNIGTPCVRKLWLEHHHPLPGEDIKADTFNKFIYGDLIESYFIFLIELSGHKVEGSQDEQSLYGIKGHRDVVVDGVLLDIKSCSSYSYDKFKNHLSPEQDAFGYIPQLMSYLKAGQDDPIVTDKNRAAFLAIDKVTGSFCLDFHEYDPNFDWENFYNTRINTVNNKNEIPERFFEPKADGYKNKNSGEFVPNGNKYLDTNCSYCPQKFNCWENIRTFVRSGKPVFFTEVVKEPKLFEIK